MEPHAVQVHRRSLQALLGTAVEIAERSGRKRANRVATELQRAQLSVPVLGGGLWYEDKPKDSMFSIAPIMRRDALLASADEYVRYFSEPAGFGSYKGLYLPSTRTIYLPVEWPISARWMAILLLHEAYHALDQISGRSASLPSWQQEVRARRFESSILIGLFGRRLDRIVDQLMSSIAKASSQAPLHEYLIPPSLDADLALLFGAPISLFDRAEQREAVRRVAIGRYLRRTHAGTKQLRGAMPLP